MIISLDNQKIKLLNKLKQKKYRQQEKQYFVEGEHLVQMALEHNKASHVFLTEQYEVEANGDVYKGNEFLFVLETAYDYISDEVSGKIKETMTSQGIFAICNMSDATFDGGNILIFDDVQDPGNMGTIIRTAKAFNCSNFYFTGGCVDVFNEKVIRATQGAIFLSQLFFEKTNETLLQDIVASHELFVLDLVGIQIDELAINMQKPYALVVGNEAHGIYDERWEDFTLTKVTIPMNQEIESLNVGVATGIMLHQLSRQNR